MEQRLFLLENDFAANLSMLQKYPPIDVIYLLERASELQERDSKKTNKEMVLELFDTAKANGKEVLEDSMKRLASSAQHIKQMLINANVFDSS
jgi:hypothetical protein